MFTENKRKQISCDILRLIESLQDVRKDFAEVEIWDEWQYIAIHSRSLQVVGEVEKLKADQQEAMVSGWIYFIILKCQMLDCCNQIATLYAIFYQDSILAEFQTVLKSADDMKDKLNMPQE